MNTTKMHCGCEFETDVNGRIIFDPDTEKLRKDCPITWDLICSGNTKGVFQLEKQKDNARKVEPHNLEELSDLIAIIRPGVTESFIDGKNLTNHYIDRKHHRDDVKYIHAALEPILKSTQGILVYQEQALSIAKNIAGYNLQEAEILRKAIGKKIAELMSKIEGEFIEKTIQTGILNKEEAEQVFSWIKASQRYSFNKSHSYSYAENAYLTAYCKAHFPHEFFTSYLKHSIGKPDSFEEIAELISNAKLMDIEVKPPNIRLLQREFKLVGKSPTFGLTNIKKVGNSVFDKILTQYNEYKKKGYPLSLENMNFDQFLLYYGPCIKSDSMQALILSGACDCFGLYRLEMEHRYNLYKELSDRELKYIASQADILHRFKSLNDFINHMILNNQWDDPKRPIYRKNRLDALDSILSLLENRTHNLQDSLTFKAMKEQEYLGTALTCSKVDDHDTTYANCTCKEFVNGFDSQSGIAIAAELKSIREWTIKAEGESKGKKMAFITIGDSTCDMDNAVMFAEDYEKFKDRLIPKSVFMFRGMRQKKKNGFLIKNVTSL